ncbi:DUF6584 family protein [Kitasatospora sp. CB01950]|uniref:DUF6584 family protein n=1 Tax=Kitasatospora sp. CB01950 TaxID=1703930 RepID=UPI00093F8C9E|nr:DUF6584 family protein [Kitasatospora sp. CB01950]
MSVESTLAKAAADRRECRYGLARRRLYGLLSSYPTDLTIRLAIAGAHGYDPPQAGRWNYLDDSLTTTELAAFEKQFRDPARRLAVLRWPDPDRNPPSTPTARRRLAALHRAATGKAPNWPDHPEDATAPAPPPREPEPLYLPLPPPPPIALPYRKPEPPAHLWPKRIALLLCLAALTWLYFR